MTSNGAPKAPSRHIRTFHNWKSEYADNSIRKAQERGLLTSEDGSRISEFIAESKATKGICTGRANKVTFTLVQWRRFIGPFRGNTITDLYKGIERLKEARNDGKPYKQNTVRDFINALKRFYHWLISNGYSNVQIEKVKAIKAPRTDSMTKTAEMMLTEDEVRAMIDVCQNSRDRAILATLYEGGFRIEEIGDLTWEQTKFDDYGTIINVNKKTERPRYVRLVSATQYLISWKNDYPFPITADAPVFLSFQHLPLEYAAVSQQLKKIGKRAGITKKITPHLFRHSRITAMLQKGYNESIIKKTMWGNINTTMFETYVHLTDTDIDNEILGKQGIRRQEIIRSDAMDARQCVNCNTINAPTSRFCSTCGEPLTDDARVSLERMKRDIEQTPEYKKIMGMVRQQLAAGA